MLSHKITYILWFIHIIWLCLSCFSFSHLLKKAQKAWPFLKTLQSASKVLVQEKNLQDKLPNLTFIQTHLTLELIQKTFGLTEMKRGLRNLFSTNFSCEGIVVCKGSTGAGEVFNKIQFFCDFLRNPHGTIKCFHLEEWKLMKKY